MTGNSADSDMDRSPLETLQKLKTYDSEYRYPISEWQSWMDYGLAKFEPLKALEHSSLNLFIGVLQGSRLWTDFCDMTLIFEVQICSFLVFMVFLSNLLSIPRKGRNRQHRATPRPSLESKFLELPQIRRAGPRAQGIVFFHLVT